jgi:hypothetical protein
MPVVNVTTREPLNGFPYTVILDMLGRIDKCLQCSCGSDNWVMTTDPVSVCACMSICICAVHISIEFLSHSVVALPTYGKKSSGAAHFYVWSSGYWL